MSASRHIALRGTGLARYQTQKTTTQNRGKARRIHTMTKQISAVWVGNTFFQSALKDLGWRVHWMNPNRNTVLGWTDIVDAAGFVPDVLIVADKSLPPFVAGTECFPCLTVFYAVDTHIHSWFPFYAQGFDLVLVSLRDHIPLFRGRRLKSDMVIWSPPYANPKDAPRPPDPSKPQWDVLFVGTVDPEINPDRCAFLEAVKERVPGLHVTRGLYQQLYPQAKIVLNHTAGNDLNFRVFEALGSGACLATPFVRHGFEELFWNGADLFTYNQGDIEGLAKLLTVLLAAPERRRKVAAHGRETVQAGHFMRHRAGAFASRIREILDSGRAAEMIDARTRNATSILSAWLKLMYLHHAETASDPALEVAYLKASKG